MDGVRVPAPGPAVPGVALPRLSCVATQARLPSTAFAGRAHHSPAHISAQTWQRRSPSRIINSEATDCSENWHQFPHSSPNWHHFDSGMLTTGWPTAGTLTTLMPKIVWVVGGGSHSHPQPHPGGRPTTLSTPFPYFQFLFPVSCFEVSFSFSALAAEGIFLWAVS